MQRLRAAYRSLGEELEHLATTPAFAAGPPAMQLNRLSTRQVHDFARFHAAAAALANGYREVQVSGPQTRLLVDGCVVQVISRRQARSPWHVSADHPVVDDATAVIFVDLTGREPEFYVAPAEWVRDDVKRHHDSWLASKGGIRPRNPKSDHHAVELYRIEQWHECWELATAGNQ